MFSASRSQPARAQECATKHSTSQDSAIFGVTVLVPAMPAKGRADNRINVGETGRPAELPTIRGPATRRAPAGHPVLDRQSRTESSARRLARMPERPRTRLSQCRSQGSSRARTPAEVSRAPADGPGPDPRRARNPARSRRHASAIVRRRCGDGHGVRERSPTPAGSDDFRGVDARRAHRPRLRRWR